MFIIWIPLEQTTERGYNRRKHVAILSLPVASALKQTKLDTFVFIILASPELIISFENNRYLTLSYQVICKYLYLAACDEYSVLIRDM